MKSIVIATALVAITALGVGATVSANPGAAKQTAARDANACAVMSAAECASCPMGGNCPTGGGNDCGPCSPADAGTCRRK